MEAEAVNGSDLSILHHNRLLLQMFIARILFQLLLDGVVDPLAHLRGRRLGKRHHQQPLNIPRPLPVRDHPDDSLHQNCGLSAPCSG